jgi:hypothetical protein
MRRGGLGLSGRTLLRRLALMRLGLMRFGLAGFGRIGHDRPVVVVLRERRSHAQRDVSKQQRGDRELRKGSNGMRRVRSNRALIVQPLSLYSLSRSCLLVMITLPAVQIISRLFA